MAGEPRGSWRSRRDARVAPRSIANRWWRRAATVERGRDYSRGTAQQHPGLDGGSNALARVYGGGDRGRSVGPEPRALPTAPPQRGSARDCAGNAALSAQLELLRSSTMTRLDTVTNLTDLGNARRLVRRHGKDLRYCLAWGKWLSWDGRRWRIDDSGEVMRRAKATALSIYE